MIWYAGRKYFTKPGSVFTLGVSYVRFLFHWANNANIPLVSYFLTNSVTIHWALSLVARKTRCSLFRAIVIHAFKNELLLTICVPKKRQSINVFMYSPIWLILRVKRTILLTHKGFSANSMYSILLLCISSLYLTMWWLDHATRPQNIHP